MRKQREKYEFMRPLYKLYIFHFAELKVRKFDENILKYD